MRIGHFLSTGLLLFASVLILRPSFGQEIPAQPLFASHDPLIITVSADWKAVLKDRGDERSEHEASLSYMDADSSEVSLPLQVRVRGNSRRQKRVCEFPPIRLNLKKKTVPNTLFENQDKLKLVTHCQSNRSKYEQFNLQEYLIYRAYNLFSDYSFQVRLVHITYQPTNGGKPLTRYGFLIEDKDLLTERLQGRLLEDVQLHQEAIADNNITRLSVFQYLIANTDWSVPIQHNLVTLGVPEQTHPIVVPYDFDWSGVINTPYAVPAKILPIKEVTDRLYRGYCRPIESLQPHFDVFNEKKEALYQLYQDFEPLSRRERNRILGYYDDFYKVINDPHLSKREFIAGCRSYR